MCEGLNSEKLYHELKQCYIELEEKDTVIEHHEKMINQMSAAIGRQAWREMVEAAAERKNRRRFNWR